MYAAIPGIAMFRALFMKTSLASGGASSIFSGSVDEATTDPADRKFTTIRYSPFSRSCNGIVFDLSSRPFRNSAAAMLSVNVRRISRDCVFAITYSAS